MATSTLGGAALLTEIQFAIVGRLIAGPEFAADLKKWFRDEYHYRPPTGIIAEYHLFRKIEETGLIRAFKHDDGRAFYKATKEGFDRWKKTFDFRKEMLGKWEEVRQKPRSLDDFPDADPTEKRDPISERYPKEDEQAKIVSLANPAFARLFKFSMATKTRYTALLSARIEKLDMKRNILKLEAESADRENDIESVPLNQEALGILKEAIAGRKTGLIFVNLQNKPWKESHVSSVFRKLRERAGISNDVMFAGRGGRAGDFEETEEQE